MKPLTAPSNAPQQTTTIAASAGLRSASVHQQGADRAGQEGGRSDRNIEPARHHYQRQPGGGDRKRIHRAEDVKDIVDLKEMLGGQREENENDREHDKKAALKQKVGYFSSDGHEAASRSLSIIAIDRHQRGRIGGAGQFVDQSTAADDQIAVADPHQFLKLGRHQQDAASLLRQFDDKPHDFGLGADVEAAGRLVQQRTGAGWSRAIARTRPSADCRRLAWRRSARAPRP